MPTRASRAAIDIAERLRAQEFPPPLKAPAATRVQGWIDRGWLGPVAWHHPGGGGSKTALGSDALEVAELITCLPAKERNDDNVVLVRYLRGLAVGEDEVRHALGAAVDEVYRVAGMQEVAGADEDTVFDAAEKKAREVLQSRRRPASLKASEPRLRSWAENSGDEELAGLPTSELLGQALTPLFAMLADDLEAVGAGIGPLAAAAGLQPVMEEASVAGWRPVDMRDEAAKKVAAILEDWRFVADNVTLDELVLARRIQLAVLGLGAPGVVDSSKVELVSHGGPCTTPSGAPALHGWSRRAAVSMTAPSCCRPWKRRSRRSAALRGKAATSSS
jgi:hypothetical protein